MKEPVAKLLLNLASPCDGSDENIDELGLCPKSVDDIPSILANLLVAFLIKGFLTVITFGIVGFSRHVKHCWQHATNIGCRKYRPASTFPPW